jgi:dipeptidyl aminopeptidase/acylaminoacyl peptidase
MSSRLPAIGLGFAVVLANQGGVRLRDEILYRLPARPIALAGAGPSGSFAIALPAAGRVRVVVNGRQEGVFLEVLAPTPGQPFVFSEDGARLAYAARTPRGWQVFFDGQPGPVVTGIQDLQVSRTGTLHTYKATIGVEKRLFVNGAPATGRPLATPVQFDRAERSFAYVIEGPNGQAVVHDGRVVDWERGILHASLQISPDGQRVAYQAVGDSGHVVVVGGRRYGPFDPFPEGADIIFSPDGSRVAAAVMAGGVPSLLEVDSAGTVSRRPTQGLPTAITFSADGRRIAYVESFRGRERVVVDTSPGPWYQGIGSFDDGRRLQSTLGFGPDGKRVSYTASPDGAQWLAVIDGSEGEPWDAIVGPVQFSPDGTRTAFFATRAGVRYAVVDGRRSEGFDDSQRGGTFTQDDRHFLFTARRGRTHHLFVDGRPVAERRQAPRSRFYAGAKGVVQVVTLSEVEGAVMLTTIELP